MVSNVAWLGLVSTFSCRYLLSICKGTYKIALNSFSSFVLVKTNGTYIIQLLSYVYSRQSVQLCVEVKEDEEDFILNCVRNENKLNLKYKVK